MNTPTTPPAIPDLAGYDLGSRDVGYSESDAILYALAVGAGAGDLDQVYERDLRVLPTYGLVLGLWAVEAAGSIGSYDRLRSLHGAQRLTVHESLPPSDVLRLHGRVAAVWDKGKSAILDIEVTCPRFTATYSIVVPGAGGWGGERGPAGAPSSAPSATWHADYATSPELAALYRLTGDRHPVHIDPEVAAANGFAGPILHGLCTLGFTARTVADAVGAHPCDLVELDTRFVAPVMPGDTVRISAGTTVDSAYFAAHVEDTAVLSNGRARFRAGTAPVDEASSEWKGERR